jgi:hypothetical protein
MGWTWCERVPNPIRASNLRQNSFEVGRQSASAGNRLAPKPLRGSLVERRAQLGCMVWIVAAPTIPRPVPGSEEPWATQCEASQDAQNLEGGVRA